MLFDLSNNGAREVVDVQGMWFILFTYTVFKTRAHVVLVLRDLLIGVGAGGRLI